jgi:hypothetical protein
MAAEFWDSEEAMDEEDRRRDARRRRYGWDKPVHNYIKEWQEKYPEEMA